MPLPRSALPELEDLLLAQCEGDWVSVPMAIAVLGSWLDRDLSRSELTGALDRLSGAGLVISRNFLHLPEQSTKISSAADCVEFIATQAGIEYLGSTRG